MINRHVLYDVWVDDRAVIATVEPVKDLLCRAAHAGGATILHSYFHQFSPHGVTGFLLLAESHISVHTWVDEGFAAFDIFTCGNMDTNKALEVIREGLRPRDASVRRFVRGGDSAPALANTPIARDAAFKPHEE